MPDILEGNLIASDAGYAVVVSRFNRFITERLLEGALDALRRHGADMDRVTVAWCPGAFEIPLVAKKLAAGGAYDAVICLGAVIRGATAHYEVVVSGVGGGVGSAALETGVPIILGVLTTDTIEQAVERAGSKAGNKGEEAALTAIEMVNLLRRL